MGFCTPLEHQRFLRQCPMFEQMLVEDGILLRKYWFSVSDDEQERRFRARLDDPTKRWKLTEMDLESRRHFVDYSRAKDEMFVHTDTAHAPWWVVEADSKRSARVNCIAHLLSDDPLRGARRRAARAPGAAGRRRLRPSRSGPDAPRARPRRQRRGRAASLTEARGTGTALG